MYCVLTSIAQQSANPCPANEGKQIKPLTCSFTIFILVYLLDTIANWWEIVLKKQAKREANSWNLCWNLPLRPLQAMTTLGWAGVVYGCFWGDGKDYVITFGMNRRYRQLIFFWCGICTGVDICGLIGDWCSFIGEVAPLSVLLCYCTVFYEPCFMSHVLRAELSRDDWVVSGCSTRLVWHCRYIGGESGWLCL